LFGSRKRGSASQSQVVEEKKIKISHENNKSKKHAKSKKKKHMECEWSVSVTEVSDHKSDDNKTDTISESEFPSDDSSGREDYQHYTFASNSRKLDSDFDDEEVKSLSSRRMSGGDKSSISAFLPPQQLPWSWSDEGHKMSTKSRKVFHDGIVKDDETMSVGDCAVFLSTGRPDRPYIGQIDSMWQTAAGGMKVKVKWFYHQAEVEGTAVGGGRVEDIKTEGALFSSSHYDENDIQTISHKCQVLKYSEFTNVVRSEDVDMDSNDSYYLAGEYDPVEGTIVFAPGLLR
jgi:hypothetical protein